MYEAHPIFIQPQNENSKVWRYMDFTKLVSLIDSRRLYFTRVDKFGDPFEGSWPRMNVIARQQIPDSIPEEGRDNFIKSMENMREFSKNWPRYNAINCWHLNEHESAAMWKLYLKSDEGIAICSSYAKLKRCLIDEDTIFLGVVKYIDYETEWIQDGNVLAPFVHKRKSFEHEQEIRALIAKWPVGEHELDFTKETISHGVQIKVDIETLIERIYIAPSSPAWFADLVKAIVNRYGYTFEVVHSRLYEQPVF
jgi:hypothetical protein